MDEVDKAWLAAAIDGEGTISIVKRGVFVGVYNKNYDFLLKVQKLFGDGIGGITKHSSCHKYVCFRQDINLKILSEILPYLIIKKDNAVQCIDFLNDKIQNLNFDAPIPILVHSGHSLAGKSGRHYLKGFKGNSEQHRLNALKAKNNHLKGNRGDSEGHRMNSLRCNKNYLKGYRGDSEGHRLNVLKRNKIVSYKYKNKNNTKTKTTTM